MVVLLCAQTLKRLNFRFYCQCVNSFIILEMTPTNAGWLNTIYYAAYTIGRLVSIPLSTIASPAIIIVNSCIGCLFATIILIFFGNYNSYALFASTGNFI